MGRPKGAKNLPKMPLPDTSGPIWYLRCRCGAAIEAYRTEEERAAARVTRCSTCWKTSGKVTPFTHGRTNGSDSDDA